MKQTKIWGAALIAVLMTLSCARENEVFVPSPAGSRSLTLNVSCSDMPTRATIPGEDGFNENTINDYYYFLFADTTSTAFTWGHVTGNTSTTFVFDETEHAAIISAGKCYAYILANLPTGTSTNASDYFTYDGQVNHTFTGRESLAKLKEIALQSQFCTDNALNGNVFTNNKFVMRTAKCQEIPVTEGGNSVTVPLSRVAAKIVLDLDVAKLIKQFSTNTSGGEDYVRTWEALYEKIQIYMLWVSDHGTLQGVPIRYNKTTGSDDTSQYFFTYPRYCMFDGGTATGDFIARPYGENSDTLSTTKSFSTMVWGHVNDEVQALHPERTYTYDAESGRTTISFDQKVFAMESVPFYTYPISWQNSDANAPFIKIILPWIGYNEANMETVDDGEEREFYYKITMPGLNEFKSNDCYRINLDLAVLGNTVDEVDVEISGNYYVVDWNTPAESEPVLDAGQYLGTSREVYYMYGIEDLEIATTTSHPLDADLIAITSTYKNGSGNTVTGLPSGSSAATATIEGNSIKFHHDLREEITNDNQANLDVYVTTFTLTLGNEAGLTRTVEIIQYPPIYVDFKPGDNVFVNGYFAHVSDPQRNGVGAWALNNNGYYSSSTRSQANNGYYVWSGPSQANSYCSIAGTLYTQYTSNLTVLNISAISGDLTFKDHTGNDVHYLIADPREASGWNGSLRDYLSGGNPTYTNPVTSSWNGLNDVKKGTTQTNIIAPALLFASGYGSMRYRTGNLPNWQQSSYRCATYQEGGYPAGRWRLPTEAEINFVQTLQNKDLITDLFAGYQYFSSSGYTVSQGGVYSSQSYVDDATFNNASLRCVYDIWYWGEEPETTYEYHPEP